MPIITPELFEFREVGDWEIWLEDEKMLKEYGLQEDTWKGVSALTFILIRRFY